MALIKSKQIESLHADKIIETNDRKFVTEEQILRWDTGAGSSGTPGQDGKNIELTKNDTHIMWRVEGEDDWQELVALADITGPAGADGTGSSLPNEDVLLNISEDNDGQLLYKGKPIEADVDITNLLDKNTYDSDNDGIVDKAKLLEGMTENGLAQLLKLLELIQSSNPQQYFGTNSENKLGMYYFPINRDGSNSLDQKVILNASKGQIIPIESVTDINQKALVQVYKYIEGEQDIIHTLKEFNNSNSDNFIYSNNVEFNDSCHIKNEYIVHSTLNEITGLYETKLNKGEFIDINKITYEDNSTRTGLQFKNSEGSVFYCDYNGKSYYDKTPIMSSNTTGNYKTSASSYESSGYSPYKAFDNSLSTSWCIKPYQSEGWLSIGNTIEKFKINAIGIYAPYNYSSANALTEAFRNFKIEGSNDNISWQTIKEIKTGDYEKDVIKIFNLGNIETYNYFRLYEENVDNRKYVCASEIKLLLEVEAPYFLIKDNSTNTIYNYDEENNSLVEVADVSILKESVENNTCIYNLNKVIPLLNNLSDDLTLLCNNNNSVNIQGIKSNKELIVGKQSFSTSIASNIDYFKLDDEASNIKIAFSIDDGLTWKTYNEDTSTFEDMQITIPVDKKYNDFDETDLLNWNNAKETIYNNGIDASALNVIDFNVLDMKRVKFAYVLSASSVDDMSKMKQLIWQFDAHGYVELCSNSDVNIQIASSGIQLKSNIDADMLKVNIAWNSKSDNNAFYF